MMTIFTNTNKASSMIGRFKSWKQRSTCNRYYTNQFGRPSICEDGSRKSTYITRREIPQNSSDKFLNFIVICLSEESNQRGDAGGVLDRSLVLVVLPAVRQIPAKNIPK